ncbi:rhodanese-like domain-containing protein [Dermatobacter hominis]|uniref:rhodanese-like domain-containing protein n=1 Tax=Dermatobacter hominis TaxID=2884263 RepID=UPI001D10B61F|nr:rhodanese-like domain-containing protein [Dermatobacter hominis]UDY34259.1 hypothetical protein LH044_13020 [Dermatobacter hominis]
MTASNVDRLLAAARDELGVRPTPADLRELLAGGAWVVDIRPIGLREADGPIGGAVVVDRNQLEWRLDPTSPHRLDGFDDPNRTVVLVCDEGYASSLAAVSLRRLGLPGATDLDGGYQALAAAGLTDLT